MRFCLDGFKNTVGEYMFRFTLEHIEDLTNEARTKEKNNFHVLWLHVLLSTRKSRKTLVRLHTQRNLCRSASRVRGFSL